MSEHGYFAQRQNILVLATAASDKNRKTMPACCGFPPRLEVAPSSILKYFIWIIIAVAALFWSWQSWSQDILGDEVGYAFRSIGYLDYLGTSFQTTPVEWYNNLSLPWWTKLSFHDHPPLFFIIQNIFFRIFGDTVFAARLPALVAGIFSIYLFYILVRRFTNEKLAIIAAGLMAVSGGMVSLFRSSLIEPVLLALILFSIHAFFLFLDNKKYFWLWGVSLGLVALMKYIGVFIVLVYLAYLMIFRRDILRRPHFYLALVLALMIFLPVIIYNYYLYTQKGHFDLQLAYLLGQETPEWTAQLGKSQNTFSAIGKNLIIFYGPAGLGLVALGFLLVLILLFKSRLKNIPPSTREGLVFLGLYALFLTLLLIFIGSAHRFLGLYAPVFFMLAGAMIYKLFFSFRTVWLFRALAVILIITEIWYAVRTNFANAHDFGIQKLDAYFEEEFAGRASAVIPQTDNTHLNEVIKNIARARPEASTHFSVIVYNDNVDITTILWIFTRKFFYDSVPTMYIENFIKILTAEGIRAFDGFTVYFVQSTPATLLNPFKIDDTTGDRFEAELIERGVGSPKSIAGRRGIEMFRVYKLDPAEAARVFGR